jgi:hypothetical protein
MSITYSNMIEGRNRQLPLLWFVDTRMTLFGRRKMK